MRLSGAERPWLRPVPAVGGEQRTIEFKTVVVRR
jgi:hypothetical protein